MSDGYAVPRCPTCGEAAVESEVSAYWQDQRPGSLSNVGDPVPCAVTHACPNEHEWTTDVKIEAPA